MRQFLNRVICSVLLLAAAGPDACAQRPQPVHRAKNIEIIPVNHMLLQLPGRAAEPFTGHRLLYHRIAYGLQFEGPEALQKDGELAADARRLATTYYHRHSPIGIALERFNWFPGPMNTFSADARLPAALVGGAGQQAFANLLVGMWSEPPVGVVGLHMGTLASYARPLQTMHFFEHNPDLIELNFPEPKSRRFFHFVPDAVSRGARVQALEGDSRALLEKAPDGFYHVLVVEAIKEGFDQKLREKLLTREGLKLCMAKLAPGGVLCFHTSCRYYKLDALVGATAMSLGYAVVVGRDGYVSDRHDGAYTSEWVMVARNRAELKHLQPPPGYAELARKNNLSPQYWQPPLMTKVAAWTDDKIDYKGLYRGDPHLVPVLRIMVNDTLDYVVPNHRGRYYGTVEGVLRALDEVRVEQLNLGRK